MQTRDRSHAFLAKLVLCALSPFLAGFLCSRASTQEDYSVVKILPDRPHAWSFENPVHVAVDSMGNFYVADSKKATIYKFDPSGRCVAGWGSRGTGDGQFRVPDWSAGGPSGIAADSFGNVYAADPLNNRIQKFDSWGNFIGKWGSYGSGDGEFDRPNSVAVDSSGNVFVVDAGNCRIQKFDSAGKFLGKWGSSGGGYGQFQSPWDIAVDTSGNVFVSDCNASRVQKFDG